ncbi:hydantoinase/oxoprolinase family protein [Halegenticoccus tardaugens]|uniref:hydantoinase/oxoprolinase family protein n=1 Tax=Halegenticoccus tardaugens TaxID=2071624 RepID=UPI002264726A|nr:hydantoinase/oxoprolinase family protein [Halegenticoccus tardaugens]
MTLSAEIASISLLERENSAILNAAVCSVVRRAIGAVQEALADRKIEARLFIVQNDGSVMDADYAERYPIFTVASGPAASIRGAVFLSGIENGVVRRRRAGYSVLSPPPRSCIWRGPTV